VASVLVDSGKATLRDTQNFLGHQRATTTDLYLKSIRPERNGIADVLDGSIPDITSDPVSKDDPADNVVRLQKSI
jgi:hypothetical protein